MVGRPQYRYRSEVLAHAAKGVVSGLPAALMVPHRRIARMEICFCKVLLLCARDVGPRLQRLPPVPFHAFNGGGP